MTAKMKVLLTLLSLVCHFGVGQVQADGLVEESLGKDLTDNEKNEDRINVEGEDSDVEILPRKEKSLLGTFPFGEPHSSSYNPQARQPLNRLHFEHGGGHSGHHGHGGYVDQAGTYHGSTHDGHEPAGNPLLRFPFENVAPVVNDHHPSNRGSDHQFQLEGSDFETSVLEKATLAQLEVEEVGEDGRKCVNKVMMREETEYDEILTCDHSYDNRCHTSYVTRYEPHQEQECEEKFRKICTIEYEQKANQEVVEVCTSSFIPDCDVEGEPVCQTVYTSECSTVQIVHEVEDDIANCETVEEEKCEDVTDGFKTERKCDTWPKEKCTISNKKVKKYTPHTSCKKVPKEACSPRGCGVKEGPVNCQDKVKTIISENPVEDCDMEPLRTCKHVTKLVPKLDTVQDCVDVPKEICSRSKVNPRKVKKPAIQKWCFTPK